jgi:hypothetical protein
MSLSYMTENNHVEDIEPSRERSRRVLYKGLDSEDSHFPRSPYPRHEGLTFSPLCFDPSPKESD